MASGGQDPRPAGGQALGDDALVAAVGDGDREALSEIHRLHGGAVWSVASRVCRGSKLAETVCESVFIELWSHPARFDPQRSTLRSWLVAEAHSRAVSEVRANPGHRRKDGNSTGMAPTSTDGDASAPAGALSADARRVLDRLDSVERDCILLSYFGGHSCRETAQRLGVPESQVKTSIRRGLLSLRHALDVEEVSQ